MMAKLPFFVSSCSCCHQKVEIPIIKLGRLINCQHCGESFVAQDPHSQSAAIDDPLQYWIRFTDHVYSTEEFELNHERDIARTPR
jgi:hypothetical protein